MNWPPLKRFREGEVVYLRCRVLHGIVTPTGEPGAAMAVIDRFGQPRADAIQQQVYVYEEQIVSMADAVRAVERRLK